jgi:hypothetical protein
LRLVSSSPRRDSPSIRIQPCSTSGGRSSALYLGTTKPPKKRLVRGIPNGSRPTDAASLAHLLTRVVGNAFKIKEHAMKANELAPGDPTTLHLLGRWCFRFAISSHSFRVQLRRHHFFARTLANMVAVLLVLAGSNAPQRLHCLAPLLRLLTRKLLHTSPRLRRCVPYLSSSHIGLVFGYAL